MVVTKHNYQKKNRLEGEINKHFSNFLFFCVPSTLFSRIKFPGTLTRTLPRREIEGRVKKGCRREKWEGGKHTVRADIARVHRAKCVSVVTSGIHTVLVSTSRTHILYYIYTRDFSSIGRTKFFFPISLRIRIYNNGKRGINQIFLEKKKDFLLHSIRETNFLLLLLLLLIRKTNICYFQFKKKFLLLFEI